MRKLIMAVVSFLVGVTALAQQSNFKEKTVFKNDDVEFRQLDEHTWHGNGHQVYNESVYLIEGEKSALLIDAGTRIPGLKKIVEDLVGKPVRSLGVSNFNRHHLEDLLSYAEVRPVINQIEVHPLFTQGENIAYNRSLGIQVQAWGPFGQGDIDIIGHPVLQGLAKKYEKTASQIVLRWIVQQGLITIPRAKPNHFAENLGVMQFALSEEDMLAISALNQNLRSNVKNDPDNFPW
ncbi:MAG: aldo/keto reductase [Bacteroidaceae bacterium]|nr:aldo/keto reductase [Bacteroidaceae bacterium]